MNIPHLDLQQPRIVGLANGLVYAILVLLEMMCVLKTIDNELWSIVENDIEQ
jgi:hypothetical protein